LSPNSQTSPENPTFAPPPFFAAIPPPPVLQRFFVRPSFSRTHFFFFSLSTFFFPHSLPLAFFVVADATLSQPRPATTLFFLRRALSLSRQQFFLPVPCVKAFPVCCRRVLFIECLCSVRSVPIFFGPDSSSLPALGPFRVAVHPAE